MIISILNQIPRFLRTKIEGRPGLLKILQNISWLFFDKILRLGVGLFVAVWVARYLGPEQYGIMNFALAFVGLFGAIASLGLQGVMVRDIVNAPKEAKVILGTTFFLRLVGGLISFILVILIINILRPNDTLTKAIAAFFGFSMIIQSSEVIKYWFESQVQSKYIIWVENGVFLLIASVKVVMILVNAPLMAFVLAIFIESILVSLLIIILYNFKVGRLQNWSFNFPRAKQLLHDSWPLILSGIAITVYMKIDQIMIGQILGDKAVGIYSAALRVSEIWYFIPMAIATSVYPTIIISKNIDEDVYMERFQKLYDIFSLIAFAVILPITLLSSRIIELLYGDAYIKAGPVLTIHIWASLFVFLGVASSNWFIVENRQILSLQRTSVGAIVNIVLNLIFIPIYGIIGAAYATVISYAVSGMFFDIFQKETKQMFTMKFRSLNIFRTIMTIRKIIKSNV